MRIDVVVFFGRFWRVCYDKLLVGYIVNYVLCEIWVWNLRIFCMDGCGVDGRIYFGNNGLSCGEIVCFSFGNVMKVLK